MNHTTRIGVLCGGLSGEREVSLRSGKNCFDALLRLGYHNTILIDVDRDIAQTLRAERIDVAFIALHGRYGEDGCIQGLLEIMGIPYTGNGVMASAIAMDKTMSKAVFEKAGLPTIPSITFSTAQIKANDLDLPPYITFPVMVKPASEGSSIGMTKVEQLTDLPSAIQTATQHSESVMVENYLSGQSITVGVFEKDGQTHVTPILELRPVKSEWYDLEAKYTPGATEFILPAEIDPMTTRNIQDVTLKAHQAIGCRGLSRTDFIVTSDRQFYILEINTAPGMTDLSDLPAQAKAMGVSYDQLVEAILNTATCLPVNQPLVNAHG